jgi:hypothetical protein
MCTQLDLKVICKISRNEGRPYNFHEFWCEEIQNKKDPSKKRILMFERYNLVDSMEPRIVVFLV